VDVGCNFRQVRMVIAKVTSRCNLRCAYCCTDAAAMSKPADEMSLETHKWAASLLIGNTESEELAWIFHGGEPMLVPIAWYEEAIRFCIDVADGNPRLKRLQIGMQSNLTRLTPEMLALVKKYRIQVGTSLDGPPHLSDIYRQGGQRVEQAIENMTQEGVAPGVIAQIHKTTFEHMEEVLDYFDVKGFGVTFNPTCPTGRGVHVDALTGQEVFEARRQILERADRSGNLMILGPDLIRQLFYFVTGRRDMTERGCHTYNCGAGVTLIGVDPEGNLWPCGRSNDADMGRFGNVRDVATLKDYQKKLTAFHEKDLWYVRCFGCAARIICPFGCTAFDKESMPTREMDCSATRLLYQYFCDHGDLAQRLVERVQTRMRKRDEEPKRLPPPFLKLRAGCPCEVPAKGESHRARHVPGAT
jgi:uncharacterized protein